MRTHITAFILLCLSFQMSAQDVVFSQFFAAPMELNPALTGLTHAPRISLNYRNQWPAIPNAYITYAVAYDQYFDNVNSGIGLNIISDVEGGGIYTTNRIDFSYAYDLRIEGDFYLRGGLEAGFVQRRLNWDKLVFLDQIDPLTGSTDGNGNPIPTEENRPDNLSRYYPDFAAGILAYSPIFYAGVAIKHLNAPDENQLNFETDFAQRPVLYSVHAGAEIPLTESNKNGQRTFISPNILFVRQADFGQVNVGAYAQAERIFGGLWYRRAWSNPDAVIFLVGFQQNIIKVGYSYDLTLSQLSSRTGGGHEVSVILNFEKRSVDYNNCLDLFR